ncbi:hypothetical protein CR513_11821, partial [Mucuna pruriens]
MGEEFMFQDLHPKKGGWVTFKGAVVNIGRIGKHPFPSIDNALYVKGLKHNLLSISQLHDSGYDVSFDKGEFIVKDYKGSIIFSTKRQNNLYKIDLADLINQNHNLLRGIPSLVYKVDMLCDACQKMKQIRGSFESKNVISTSRRLELLHIDFGPTKTISLDGKHYGLVLVDDYSRWTWVMFLAQKDESFKVFYVFCKHIQNEKSF